MQMELNFQTIQTVTPQMVAAMQVLQCSSQELSDYLEELSYENPMMELETSQPEPEALQPDVDQLRWLKQNDWQNHRYYEHASESNPEQYVADTSHDTLSDSVHEQLLTLQLSPAVAGAAELIAGMLDAHGFFTCTLRETAALAGCTPEEAMEALECIRSLEPAGIGASDVGDSILLQLGRMDPVNSVAVQLAAVHFQHLVSWSDSRLARAIGCSSAEVADAKQLISSLSPYPASGYASGEDTQYVTPDLYVTAADDAILVTASDETIPKIHINRDYLTMLEQGTDPETRKYLRQKLTQLQQVMQDLGNRRSTMQKCGEEIARCQEAFFRGGQLGKLTLRDVADVLGVHESTVSRCIRNKYIQCDRGVYPMSYFFSRDAGQNTGTSREYIMDQIRDLIAEEDARHPLNDDAIVSLLARQHLTVSRRTVAKYRMEMGILPVSGRKDRG